MNENEQDFEGLDLEDILKEFGSTPAEGPLPADEAEAAHSMGGLDELLASEEPAGPEPEEVPVESAAEAPRPEPETPAVPQDTIRLDDISKAVAESTKKGDAGDTIRLDALPLDEGPEEDPEEIPEELPEEPAPEEPAPEEPEQEPEAVPQEPIPFRPRSRLRELKKQLIAGPEKRYYELSEQGVGKLQMAIFLSLIVVLLSAGGSVLYAAGMVPENRMRLMVFSQILAMLFGALLGCYQMLEGIMDLVHGRFTLNTLLAITFVACGIDGIFCLRELRVPICAAFTLEVTMSLWSTYQRRSTEMGMMDTMRKAVRLDSVVACDDYLDGKPGYLRSEGQVESFMDHYKETTGPEKTQDFYALASLLVSVAIGIVAGVLHGVSMGVQSLSTTLLLAVPASSFVALTRPMAVLERRFHSLGTVLCGWQGIKGLSAKAVFPLRDEDIFPAGTAKMNGVKFYGDRSPDQTITYAAALMRANGGSLAPIFDQLLTSRAGVRYPAKNVQHYGNGGIGGEICGEPVLMGTLDFLKEMGVEIPEGIMVKQAVYVSIDGELSGLFAVTYSRMKFSAMGLNTLGGYRGLNPVVIAEDFMLTGPFLKEKFGVSTRRMRFPDRAQREELAAKRPAEDAPALALTTQEGLAPSAYAVTGARALRRAWSLGLAIHMIGGVLGILIALALAVLGASHLLTPLHVLSYQLLWMIPGLLITMWTKTV